MKQNILSWLRNFLFKSNRTTDIKSVKIGNQEWMVENMNVSTFRNGDLISNAKTKEAWVKAGRERKPAWCYYNNRHINCRKYGKLYNWWAVIDDRNLAPEGWRIPTLSEWEELIDHFEDATTAASKTKSNRGWKKRYGNNQNGTNESGFSGLPGGYLYSEGFFGGLGYSGHWWSSSQADIESAWGFYLEHQAKIIYPKRVGGCSVRCIRDSINN